MKYFTRSFLGILVLGLFSTCTLFIDIQDPPPNNNVNNANNVNNVNNANNANNANNIGCLNEGEPCTNASQCCSGVCTGSICAERTEICDDGIDNDNDGLTDCDDPDCANDPWCMDQDGDTFSPEQGDCDDSNPDVNPGATEICDNGKDDNCSGYTDCEDPECVDDPACNYVCGNGVVEPGEECDPQGTTIDCSELGFQSSPTVCMEGCFWDMTVCMFWEGNSVGDPCSEANDCTGVHEDFRDCMHTIVVGMDFPGGYCSRPCSDEGYDVCIGSGGSCLCLVGSCNCAKPCVTNDECREAEGYHCAIPFGSTEKFCIHTNWLLKSIETIPRNGINPSGDFVTYRGRETRLDSGPPPSEPYVRFSRIRLSGWWVTFAGLQVQRHGYRPGRHTPAAGNRPWSI